MQLPTSPRYSLPLLAQGQAQKELYHNEALTLLDFLIQPVVQSIENDPLLLSPVEGQSWIVGPDATGLWIDKDNHIAGWSAGGWRFIVPVEHMQVTRAGDSGNNGENLMFTDGSWVTNDVIAEPDGGEVIDVEARAAIDSILVTLQRVGILPD